MEKKWGSFHSLWLWLLIAIMNRCAERCPLQLYRISLIYVRFKIKSNLKHF